MHVLLDQALRHLDGEGELLKELYGIIHYAPWLLLADDMDASTLIVLYRAVLDNYARVEKVHAKASL